MTDCSTCDENEDYSDIYYHCTMDDCGHFDKDKNKWIKSISSNGSSCAKCNDYYCNICSQLTMTNFKKFIFESEDYEGEEFWTLNYKEKAKLCKSIGKYDDNDDKERNICHTCMNKAIRNAKKKTKKRKTQKKKKKKKKKKIKK